MNLVCFADERMTESQYRCFNSADKHGCHNAELYTPDRISSDFLSINQDILLQDRGAGYWLWKPYFINQIINQIGDGEIIFYSDAGIEIVDNLKYIEDQMNRDGEDIFLFSGRYKHAEWCKMDVIKYINHASLQMTETHNGPIYTMNGYESFIQVQASNMFFRNTPEVRDFVKEWLLLCQMPGFIDDSPSKETNYPSFAEHRHDQAILTCLQIKYRIPMHWFPSTTNIDRRNDFPNDNYPALFLHHRKRNNEW